jgi:hypothetical protein
MTSKRRTPEPLARSGIASPTHQYQNFGQCVSVRVGSAKPYALGLRLTWTGPSAKPCNRNPSRRSSSRPSGFSTPETLSDVSSPSGASAAYSHELSPLASGMPASRQRVYSAPLPVRSSFAKASSEASRSALHSISIVAVSALFDPLTGIYGVRPFAFVRAV